MSTGVLSSTKTTVFLQAGLELWIGEDVGKFSQPIQWTRIEPRR